MSKLYIGEYKGIKVHTYSSNLASRMDKCHVTITGWNMCASGTTVLYDIILEERKKERESESNV